MLRHLDIANIRRQLSDPWASEDPARGTLEATAEEVSALARRAYIDDDRAARREAEAILYFINIDNCFAPPLHPVASMAWTSLMRVKLGALRRRFGGCEPIGVAEMRRRVEDAVAKWGAYNHPLMTTLRESAQDLGAYRIWAKNWFGSCVGFSAQLAALVQRTTGEAKKCVLENLSDEFDHRVTHDVLRTRFYESLGLKFDVAGALDDPDRVLEATELLNARTGLAFLRDPLWALGCFYGVEANWPPECRLHLEINRQRGLDEHTLEYWTGHATADDHHSAEWLAVLEGMVRSDAECAAAVDGAVIQLRLRWQMYDAIAERIAGK
ncbi:MAG: iron-containing redox enzyme family protein [Myxococcota bacterium]|nr:iron-containing redox enzyme family protein [Deltaproteobacteria bacterium]MDQ3334977.1 iron-containing redox enzyme family protein [Myxococcota bacterium]